MKTEIITKNVQDELNIDQSVNELGETTKKIEVKTTYTPRRFSVRGLRRHTDIRTSRTPRIVY